MKMYFAFIVTFLFGLVLSLPAYAGDHHDDKYNRHARKSVDEVVLPANPARLSMLGRGLGFPFRELKVIRDMRVYGIRPWGFEPVHNGIDFIVDNTGEVLEVGDKVTVIAISNGIVKGVMPMGDEGSILLVVEVNPALYVAYNFEPQTANLNLRALQANSIKVVAGQHVKKGQKLGYLVVGEGENGGSAFGSGNPHIDMRLLLVDPAMLDPDAPLEDLISLAFSHNAIDQLPTFLCPYDYSSTRAKYAYEKILGKFDPDTQCKCPCRFSYNAEACGVGCVD